MTLIEAAPDLSVLGGVRSLVLTRSKSFLFDISEYL
jgi:hypothetical protein